MAEHEEFIEQQHAEIERYLAGEMQGAELSAFEQRLAEDQDLPKEVKIHAALQDTFGNAEELELRKKIRAASARWNDASRPSQTRVLTLRRIISIAAIVLITVGVFSWFNRGGATYADQFEPYAMMLTERSGESDNQGELAKAIQLYNGSDYARAQTAFGTLARQEPESVAYRFYEAMSMLAQGEGASAAPVFAELVQLGDHLLVQQARWYQAMALWQSEDEDAAWEVLEQINPGEYQRAESVRILQKNAR